MQGPSRPNFIFMGDVRDGEGFMLILLLVVPRYYFEDGLGIL